MKLVNGWIHAEETNANVVGKANRDARRPVRIRMISVVSAEESGLLADRLALALTNGEIRQVFGTLAEWDALAAQFRDEALDDLRRTGRG